MHPIPLLPRPPPTKSTYVLWWQGRYSNAVAAESQNFISKSGKSTCNHMVIYPNSAVPRNSAIKPAVKYCPCMVSMKYAIAPVTQGTLDSSRRTWSRSLLADVYLALFFSTLFKVETVLSSSDAGVCAVISAALRFCLDARTLLSSACRLANSSSFSLIVLRQSGEVLLEDVRCTIVQAYRGRVRDCRFYHSLSRIVIIVMYCHVLSYIVKSCHILSNIVVYCPILSNIVVYCHVLSNIVVYCQILS